MQKYWLQKQKTHVAGYLWHVGFGTSRFTLVLLPQQPQARDVRLATHTAVAGTTSHLAKNDHAHPKLRDAPKCVNTQVVLHFRWFASVLLMHNHNNWIHAFI
jgi:hypothetical protein